MATDPAFASIGTSDSTIDVRLSYKIVELFSEGLYSSPNKAIEELVVNSFDAGARRVHLLLPADLHSQDGTIAVIDDGSGMDAAGLKQHWLIGLSKKREGAATKGRQQIGKFGIGKLATYVLADRLTHISKHVGKYYSTSMDYTSIDRRLDKEIEPKAPIKIPLRELDEAQAKEALNDWLKLPAFKRGKMALFGKGAPPSWTVAIMSSLKSKVHTIRPGNLEWVLRTALPLRPDFEIWLNGKKLSPSKQEKGLLKKFVLGKDLNQLPKPAPKDIQESIDSNLPDSDERHFGLEVPGLGRITGYAETYKDLLTGKSDDIGRSYGFFVYVFGRLVNVVDGHFGISPNELRHGTFGRFRLVVHMDSLDEELRSNRESISEGPKQVIAQNILRAIFNAARVTLDKHDDEEAPGAKLGRKLADSPSSLARKPIIDLARSVVAGKAEARHLLVPANLSATQQESFIKALEERAEGNSFVTNVTVDYSAGRDAGIAQYDTATGHLRVNAWHPFVAAFHEEFVSKTAGQALELVAMAEVLAESHLHTIGVKASQISDFLFLRDQLLRNLANSVGRKGAFAISAELREARNDPDALEEKLCNAFTSLGYEVTRIGGNGKPDGVAVALRAAKNGEPQQYSVSLEAKSKEKDAGTVAAGSVKISAIVRQRNDYKCQHAIVVGRAFPTTKGEKSALAKEIEEDRSNTMQLNDPKTITLITIDDLALLVRLRPIKQLGLGQLRELFTTCSLPEESAAWVKKMQEMAVAKPPYKEIVGTIEHLQKNRKLMSVKYAALANELSHRNPPVIYETEEGLIDVCKAMAEMAPGAMFAGSETVELDQSAANVLAAIEAATKDYELAAT